MKPLLMLMTPDFTVKKGTDVRNEIVDFVNIKNIAVITDPSMRDFWNNSIIGTDKDVSIFLNTRTTSSNVIGGRPQTPLGYLLSQITGVQYRFYDSFIVGDVTKNFMLASETNKNAFNKALNEMLENNTAILTSKKASYSEPPPLVRLGLTNNVMSMSDKFPNKLKVQTFAGFMKLSNDTLSLINPNAVKTWKELVDALIPVTSIKAVEYKNECFI